MINKEQIEETILKIKEYFLDMVKDTNIAREHQEAAVLIGICEIKNRDGRVTFAKLVKFLDGRVTRNDISKILDVLEDKEKIEYCYGRLLGKKQLN